MPDHPEAVAVSRAQGATGALPESSTHRQWTPLARALAVAGDGWTLAIAAELAPGRMRLSELRARLAGVSAGLLDRYLQRMAGAGLVMRSRYREMPPRVELELTEAGRELLVVTAALARWGLRNAWSEPRPNERVDVEALVRQLPLLLDLRPPLPDAAVELVLLDSGHTPKGTGERRWLLDLRDGICRPLAHARQGAGRPERDLAARITGDAAAWIAAVGGARGRTALKLSGDRALARALLRALAPARPPTPAGARRR